MINRIYAKNYRAFEEFDIELSKINLFFGPNNSGKSSIMSLINLLSQTLASPDRTVSLLLRGGKEDFGTYRDIIYANDTRRSLVIGIEATPKLQRFFYYGTSKREKTVRGSIELEYYYRPRRHEIVLKRIKSEFPGIKTEIELLKTKRGKRYRINLLKVENKHIECNRMIGLFEHFLPLIWELFYEKNGESRYFKRGFERYITNFYLNFVEEIKSIEFIGPFREPPRRTYLFSGESPESVGTRGERTIDIITIDSFKRNGRGKHNIVEKVSNWFKQCEIAEKLQINRLTDRHFEVVLSQGGLNENMADTGYGCSQVLPILVAGYNLDEGDILLVQEPEIHLHPKAQAELGTFFYELAKEGIQTIVETHSEHMLLRLQAHVADKECDLKPEDVNIYYVYLDKDNKRKIKKLELGEDGFFKDEWPHGFFPERYNEAKKIAKASLRG